MCVRNPAASFLIPRSTPMIPPARTANIIRKEIVIKFNSAKLNDSLNTLFPPYNTYFFLLSIDCKYIQSQVLQSGLNHGIIL